MMAKEPKKRALIVEQIPSLNDDIQEALRILTAEHGIDLYTTRQRLLGGGLAHFGSGPQEKVENIARLLEEADLKTWIITPTRPRFGPNRLRSLEIQSDKLLFTTQQGTILVESNVRAIGVLADISGSVVDKQMKRMMVHNVYQGTTDNARLDEHDTRRAILMGQPVFDLYLIDAENQISNIIRALPAKFDPKGLGDKASLSSRGNLDALVKLAEGFFDDFTLQTGFGLSQLPGCHLKRKDDGSDWQQENLKHVVRFGWIMADLALQPQTHRKKAEGQEGPSIGTVAAATMLGRPELAASGALREMPGIGQVIDEIDQAVAAGEPETITKEKIDKSLPMPPEPKHRTIPWRVLVANLGAFAVIGLFVAFTKGSRIPEQVMHYGYSAGLLQAVFAVGFFWAGSNFFMLKRHIENTPTSKVRSLAMGMVEIYGQARRKYALVAPKTSTPCVYYRLRTYRRENRGNKRSTWRLKSESNSGHVPFFIEDATGKVAVDPYRASVRAGAREEGFPGQGNILLGGGSSSYDSNEKWVEEVIHEGTSLYILGDAKMLKQERKSLREKKIEKLRDLKLDRAALQKYDIDEDGQIDADEWQVAREDIEDQVLHERLNEEREATSQHDNIIIGRSSQRSHPFIIAVTKSEAHLTRNYAIYSGLLLTSSLLLGGWAVVKALQFFGIL